MGLFTCVLLVSLGFARTVQKYTLKLIDNPAVVRQVCKSEMHAHQNLLLLLTL